MVDVASVFDEEAEAVQVTEDGRFVQSFLFHATGGPRAKLSEDVDSVRTRGDQPRLALPRFLFVQAQDIL